MPSNTKKETSDNPKSSNPPSANTKSDKPLDKHLTNSSSKSAESSRNSGSSGDAKKSHLGQDGKLTLEECQWHFNNNLCLFCGAAGHRANECRKWTSRATANAARVTSNRDDSVSKND